MPTGYTADIVAGKEETFEQFIMKCARAFDALFSLQDAPLDAPIPDTIEPSNYYICKAKTLVIELEELRQMSPEGVQEEADRTYDRDVCSYGDEIRKRSNLLLRLNALLEQVWAWRPPTKGHEGLKKFMTDQLAQTIRWDCSTEYLTPPIRLTGEEWRQQRIKSLEANIAYNVEEHEAEVSRCREATEWLRQLRESLGVQS